MKLSVITVFALTTGLFGTADAQLRTPPPGAKTIIDRLHQDARATCREQRGVLRMGSHAVTTADLNGDGTADFVVDSNAYQCSTAASLYCGTLGCMVDTVVSGGSGYRHVPFVITHSPVVRPNPGGDILEVDVRASDCGPRANACTRYWRLVGGTFRMFPTLVAARNGGSASTASARPMSQAPAPSAAMREGFRLMQLPSGMRVAALNGVGPIRTLSVGCRSGTATMLLATRAPARPAEVVVSTPTRRFAAMPSAAPRPDLWEFRLSDPGLARLLTSPEAGFSVTVGGVDAGSYSLSGGGAVSAALSACGGAANAAPVVQASPPTAPVAAAQMGVMGIPIRRGYYVASHDPCARATHVYRFDSNGHAEGFADDRYGLMFIRWKRATRKRNGSYDVEYAPNPGDAPGDEIVIELKPVNTDTVDLTIQDTVRLRRCEAAQVPAWARR